MAQTARTSGTPPARLPTVQARSRPAGEPSRAETTRAPRPPSFTPRNDRPGRKPALLPNAPAPHLPATIDRPATHAPASVAGVPVQRATELVYQGLKQGSALTNFGTELSFGKLSKPQYEALKREFGGKTQVPYDGQRAYVASDFLPPALQALVNRDFDPGPPVTLGGTSGLNKNLGNDAKRDLRISSSPNCHGTAWEAMRAFQGEARSQVELAYGDAGHASAKYDQMKSLGSTSSNDAQALLASLKPGDVVAFNVGQTLAHSAVYAGGGLFFEKPDTESDESHETPYRLVPFAHVVAPIEEASGQPPEVSAFRPTSALPPTSEAYGAPTEHQAALESWAAKKGKTVGKRFTEEVDRGMSGNALGSAFNAVEVVPLSTGPDGRARPKS